jgi:putative membrane protein
MKTTGRWLYALPFLLFACNDEKNENRDSVEVADSTNQAREEKADSIGSVTVQADPEAADFLVKAANGGMTEVKLGALAKQKAAHAKVKGMGDMMSMDHNNVNQQVKQLATQRNVSLPGTIGDDKQKDLDAMAAKTGKEFDKAYVKYMIKDHEDDIALFKRAVDKVNDTDVRTFASNTLPKLQEHLDSFRMVQKIIN